jgi:hypothetical protein
MALMLRGGKHPVRGANDDVQHRSARGLPGGHKTVAVSQFLLTPLVTPPKMLGQGP